MTCEEYIIKRLERTEGEVRDFKSAYDHAERRIMMLERQLNKIADFFEIEHSDACDKNYFRINSPYIWEDDNKELFETIKEYK